MAFFCYTESMKKYQNASRGFTSMLVLLLIALVLLGILYAVAGDKLGLIIRPYAEPLITVESSGKIKVAFSPKEIVYITRDYADPIAETHAADINFDGVKDIEIVSAVGAYNLATDFYIYDSSSKTFSLYQGFPDEYMPLGDISFDPAARTLSSFHKGRGLGDIYVQNQFVFSGDRWELATSTLQDLVNYDAVGEGEGTVYYYRTVQVYSNGALSAEQTTYYKNATPDGDFNLVEVSQEEAQQKKK